MRCDGVTQGTRSCRRKARVAYGRWLGPERGYSTVGAYCRQHYASGRGSGAMRLLLPTIFEWDIVREIDSGGSLGDVIDESPVYRGRLARLQDGEVGDVPGPYVTEGGNRDERLRTVD